MAIRLHQDLDGNTYYSCEFPDLMFTSSDCTAIDFQLEMHRSVVFSSTYYLHDGSVEIYSIGSYIEELMLLSNKTVDQFTISFAPAGQSEFSSVSFMVVYCRERCMVSPADDLIVSSFLTTNLHRLIPRHGYDCLSLYHFGGGSYATLQHQFTCVARLESGEVSSYSFTSYVRHSMGVSITSIATDEIQDQLNQNLGPCQLLSFTLQIGSRKCWFYLQSCPSFYTFSFQNVFGCQEYVSIPLVTTTKIEGDFSEAMVNGKLSHYDVRHTRTFEAESSSLLHSQMEWLEQFLTSPGIALYKDNFYAGDVLISDYTFEHSDAPGAENTLKFTWQFADGRRSLHQYTLRTNIFTEQFTDQFA